MWKIMEKYIAGTSSEGVERALAIIKGYKRIEPGEIYLQSHWINSGLFRVFARQRRSST